MKNTTLKTGTFTNQSLLNEYNTQINKNFVDVRPYKVYTALLTQRGESIFSGFSNGGDPLTIGMTYQIIENGGSGWDFTNIGAPNNDLETFFVATGLIPNSWGIDGLLQGNTGAPVVTVLENTLGNVWFTYAGIGSYGINLDGLFMIDKTWTPTILIFNDSANVRDGEICEIRIDTTCFISTFNQSGIAIDNQLFNTPIEIRVYN